MKANISIVLIAAMISFLAFPDLEGIGGGRGGGARGGGGRPGGAGRAANVSRPAGNVSRPAGNISRPSSGYTRTGNLNNFSPSRSPSLSRAQYAPRSQAAQRQYQQGVQRYSPANRTALQNQARQYIQQQGITGQKLGQGREALQKSAPLRQQISGADLGNIRNEIRDNHPQLGNIFTGNFWNERNYTPAYYRPGASWARAAYWGSLYTGLGWAGTYPYYYSYDEAGNAYPVQVDTSTLAQPAGTYPSSSQTATAEPGAAQEEWMPLGDFVVAQDLNDAPYSNIFLQLALNKNGDIDGTYYNAGTNQTYDLAGLVDRQSQLARWMLSDNPNSPVMSTGLYNLTQDQTPVQVEYSNGVKQTWYLIRLPSKVE